MALLLCEEQQNRLRVITMVFRTIGIYVITSTFFTFFQNPRFAVFRTFSRTISSRSSKVIDLGVNRKHTCHVVSVAQLVARWTHDRKVVG